MLNVPPPPGGGMDADALVNAEAPPDEMPAQARYWASRAANEVVQELNKKERTYFEFARAQGFLGAWIASYCQHFGKDANDLQTWATQQIQFGGEMGELVNFRVNESRSFTDQLVTMAIGTRPAFQCYATNTNYDSLGQSEIADRIVDYMYRSRFGERKERWAVELGVYLGASWVWVRWDKDAGDPLPPTPVTGPDGQPQFVMRPMPDGTQAPAVDPRTGAPKVMMQPSGQRTGNIAIKVLAPWDQFCEPRIQDPDDHLWRTARERRSKWELANRFPQLASKIVAQQDKDEWAFEALFQGTQFMARGESETDELTVKHFYHLPSVALNPPGAENQYNPGRYICYVGDLPLIDRPLDYGVIPLVDFMPYQYLGTAFGYGKTWDALSVNTMIDQVLSDISTNLTMFARQTVVITDGSGITPLDIAQGARIIKKKPNFDDPKAIQLAEIPAASQWFVDHLQKRMQSLYGLNSVTRGDPDANITSGTMAALFHSIAIEVNSGLQSTVDNLRERVANLTLDILKVSAEHPMIVAIAGNDERDYLKSFKRGDVAGIKGVRVRTANPMMRTVAGRRDIAEMLMKIPGAVEDPAQLTEVLVSGTVTPLYDGPRKQRLRIKMEDELLQKAPPVEQAREPPPPMLPNGMQMPAPRPYTKATGVPVFQNDPHDIHLLEHGCLLSSERALTDKAFVEAVLAHMDEHWYVWEQMPPERSIAIGRKPYPRPMGMPPGPPMAGPPGPPQPQQQQQKPNGKPPEPAAKGASASTNDAPSGVKLPEPAKPPPSAQQH